MPRQWRDPDPFLAPAPREEPPEAPPAPMVNSTMQVSMCPPPPLEPPPGTDDRYAGDEGFARALREIAARSIPPAGAPGVVHTTTVPPAPRAAPPPMLVPVGRPVPRRSTAAQAEIERVLSSPRGGAYRRPYER
jgi:hypothetical protein